MIRSFRQKGLKRFYRDDDSSKLPSDLVKKIRIRLSALHSARSLNDINLPSFDFHPLKGFDPRRYSIHVNGNWCITFSFDTKAFDVDFEDYH